MNWKNGGMIAASLLAIGSTAYAQEPVPALTSPWSVEFDSTIGGNIDSSRLGRSQAQSVAVEATPVSPWSVEFALGFDNGISGNINSSGVGRLANQAVVITKNTYDEVYGTGLHMKFGGGYMFAPDMEARVTFTLQSLDADLTSMGDIGVSPLYGQYADYQSFGIDFGVRKYGSLSPKLRPYGEGTIGISFIDETDVILIAPAYNLGGNATDFYDKTAALTFGVSAGLLIETGENIGVFGQLGLRWVSGMAEIDDLEGTSLETINDSSARWTLPFLAGVRLRF